MSDAVLVIQTAFLGDVVLTTPLLTALAARHGPVDVVTTPAAAPLLETHPAVRRVIAFDKRRTDRGLAGLLRLVRRLRDARYGIAYLPHRSLRSALIAWLARVPHRVGFANGWPLLYTEHRPRARTGHEIDKLLALAGEPQHRQTMPTLEPTLGDRQAAEALLRAAGLTRPFAALAPGSIWGTKRWPGFAALATQLAGRVAVAVVGGPEDAPLGDAIVTAVRGAGGHAVNGCGKLPLRAAVALIGQAELLVTNDSAPLHFAQAMGTPTVAIFGPTVPAFGFGPRGPRDRIVELAALTCRPCSAHGPRRCPLGHHRCMRDVSVEDVMRAIEETGAVRARH